MVRAVPHQVGLELLTQCKVSQLQGCQGELTVFYSFLLFGELQIYQVQNCHHGFLARFWKHDFSKNKTKCPLLPSSLLPAISVRLVSVVTKAKAREAKVKALFLTKDPGLTEK